MPLPDATEFRARFPSAQYSALNEFDDATIDLQLEAAWIVAGDLEPELSDTPPTGLDAEATRKTQFSLELAAHTLTQEVVEGSTADASISGEPNLPFIGRDAFRQSLSTTVHGRNAILYMGRSELSDGRSDQSDDVTVTVGPIGGGGDTYEDAGLQGQSAYSRWGYA